MCSGICVFAYLSYLPISLCYCSVVFICWPSFFVFLTPSPGFRFGFSVAAKRLVGKSICEMACFLSSGTLNHNSVHQSGSFSASWADRWFLTGSVFHSCQSHLHLVFLSTAGWNIKWLPMLFRQWNKKKLHLMNTYCKRRYSRHSLAQHELFHRGAWHFQYGHNDAMLGNPPK